jgi:hypothetical protein
MTAKATLVRMPTPGKNLGKFHCKYFNMFDAEQMEEYSSLRQMDSDSSSGLEISHMREFIRKVRDEEYSGEEKTVHEEEFPYVYVEWWEKKLKRKKGDSHAERKEAGAGWRD